jgi:F-type H+-transporting ATPase subunit gamma
MAGAKEIRTKIKSVKNTQKITRAMEKVAISKMRRAQVRMGEARPYAEKIRRTIAHLAQANTEVTHPFMAERPVKRVGVLVITTDRGLCGGLNTNLLRAVTNKLRELEKAGESIRVTAIGAKGLGFMNRIGAKVVSQLTQLGDTPHLEKLIGPVKVQLDAYTRGEIDQVFLCYTRFLNTMKQEPVVEQLLPLSPDKLQEDSRDFQWDYLYEPDAQTVLDDLLLRYVESLIYQAVAENMASEQSARMVAMKAASDNAKKVIGELQLSYNKARQAAITKELSEIVAGAAAV